MREKILSNILASGSAEEDIETYYAKMVEAKKKQQWWHAFEWALDVYSG